MVTTRTTRRRFQFELGTVFVVVTVFALWLGWELKFIRDRQAFLLWRDTKCEAERQENAGLANPVAIWVRTESATVPIWRSWLGDEPAEFIVLPRDSSTIDQNRAKTLFPESLVYAADGTLVAGDKP